MPDNHEARFERIERHLEAHAAAMAAHAAAMAAHDAAIQRIDARLDRITERHEALAQTVEIIASMQRATEESMRTRFAQLTDALTRLVNIVENHQRRLDDLESQ